MASSALLLVPFPSSGSVPLLWFRSPPPRLPQSHYPWMPIHTVVSTDSVCVYCCVCVCVYTVCVYTVCVHTHTIFPPCPRLIKARCCHRFHRLSRRLGHRRVLADSRLRLLSICTAVTAAHAYAPPCTAQTGYRATTGATLATTCAGFHNLGLNLSIPCPRPSATSRTNTQSPTENSTWGEPRHTVCTHCTR